MLTIADFKLGRMAFPTIEDVLKEAVGDALEATGLGLAAGEGRARPFLLTIPVRASSGEVNPYLDGDRMRRQIRSMMENPKLKLGGLYAKFSFDSELNAWLLIGAGDLEYDEGGVTFASYKLSLSDSYMAGRLRTHRPARRVESVDRRLSTTPRDIEKLIYATHFASSAAYATLALPSGANDIRARAPGAIIQAPAIATADGGSLTPLKGVVQGDVLSYDQLEASMDLGDVLVLDRRGAKAPTGLMEVKEPQASYGWEEVYGSDFPLSAEDVPVLSNGLCRVRYASAPGPSFALDQFSGGAWVERGRIVPMANTTAASAFTFAAQPAIVKEWTPERAVVLSRFTCGATGVVDVYMILQRGWSAPRVEMYARLNSEVRPNVAFYPADSNGMVLDLTGGGTAGTRVSTEGWAASNAIGEANEPWVSLAPIAGTAPRMSFAVGGPCNVVQVENTFYYESTRYGLRIEGSQKASSTLNGWCGVEFAIGGTETVKLLEAEAFRNTGSATATQIADAEGSGGQVVNDTQTAETTQTVSATAGALGLVVGATYQVYARVKVITGGTGKVRAGSGGNTGEVKEFTSLTFVWVNLGKLVQVGASAFRINLWRTTAGSVRIDRFQLVPHTNPSTFDSVGDIGAASLTDTRALPELVAR